MGHLPDAIHTSRLMPTTLTGAIFWGVVFLLSATVLAAMIRRGTRRVSRHLSDTTGLRFISAFFQLMAYLAAFVLYARLVPQLRTLGTTLLAGVSIVSVIVGIAAQSTIGNIVAGFSLVLYRPIRVGDSLQINSPKGLITATVQVVSLGYTVLIDTEGHEVIVPNSVMVSSVVIRIGKAG